MRIKDVITQDRRICSLVLGVTGLNAGNLSCSKRRVQPVIVRWTKICAIFVNSFLSLITQWPAFSVKIHNNVKVFLVDQTRSWECIGLCGNLDPYLQVIWERNGGKEGELTSFSKIRIARLWIINCYFSFIFTFRSSGSLIIDAHRFTMKAIFIFVLALMIVSTSARSYRKFKGEYFLA